MELLKYVEGPAGDVIAPYVKDGVFVKDFYMKDRIAAQVGASVEEYSKANVILAGTPYKEAHVLGPEDPKKYWTESMTSSGDLGWNEAGKTYEWSPFLDDSENAKRWFQAGRPYGGKWGDLGVPIASEVYGRLRVDQRLEQYPDGDPMIVARQNAKGGKKPSRWNSK